MPKFINRRPDDTWQLSDEDKPREMAILYGLHGEVYDALQNLADPDQEAEIEQALEDAHFTLEARNVFESIGPKRTQLNAVEAVVLSLNFGVRTPKLKGMKIISYAGEIVDYDEKISTLTEEKPSYTLPEIAGFFGFSRARARQHRDEAKVKAWIVAHDQEKAREWQERIKAQAKNLKIIF